MTTNKNSPTNRPTNLPSASKPIPVRHHRQVVSSLITGNLRMISSILVMPHLQVSIPPRHLHIISCLPTMHPPQVTCLQMHLPQISSLLPNSEHLPCNICRGNYDTDQDWINNGPQWHRGMHSTGSNPARTRDTWSFPPTRPGYHRIHAVATGDFSHACCQTGSALRQPINFNLLSHTMIPYMAHDDVIVQYIIYVRTWYKSNSSGNSIV